MKWTYSKAGVDLQKHRKMHERVLAKIKELSDTLGVNVNLEEYGPSFNLEDKELVLHVDGVGTKTLVLQELDKLWVAGWDCVAMNVNDVVCTGARPIALTDYIAMPEANEEIFNDVVSGMIKAAELSRTLILGGETAIMSDLVNGIDVVCNVVAVKEHSKRFKAKAEIGDVLIGIKSNGPHANGFTLIRRILKERYGRYDVVVDGFDLGEWITRPTLIYSTAVLRLIKGGLINSAAHITGGAFSKLRRILPENADIIISFDERERGFDVLRRVGGIDIKEMYKVFNMGIGMVVSTKRDNIDLVLSLIEKEGLYGRVVGKVVKGSRRIIIKDKEAGIIEL